MKIQEKTSAGEEPTLDMLAREGARRMIAAVLEAEVDEYIRRLQGCRDERGRAEVVRNGHAQPRGVTLRAGTVELSAPRALKARGI